MQSGCETWTEIVLCKRNSPGDTLLMTRGEWSTISGTPDTHSLGCWGACVGRVRSGARCARSEGARLLGPLSRCITRLGLRPNSLILLLAPA